MTEKYLKYKKKYLDLKRRLKDQLIIQSINSYSNEKDIFMNIIFPYLKKNNICLTDRSNKRDISYF